jgi:hypothetical protein
MSNFAPRALSILLRMSLTRDIRRTVGAWCCGLLVACGGGGDGPASPATPSMPAAPAPPSTTATLTVHVIDTAGLPVAGASVWLNGGFDGMGRTTDATGKATFDFAQVPAGEASLGAGSQNHHTAGRRFKIDTSLADPVQVTLLRLEEATAKVMDAAATVTDDAATLTIEAAISVTDKNGDSIGTLTLNDFRAPARFDCNGFDWCLLEPSGQVSNAGWRPAPSPNPVAAALAGTAPAASYRVRFVLRAWPDAPNTFTAGRTVNAALTVRLGVDTWVWLDFPVRL